MDIRLLSSTRIKLVLETRLKTPACSTVTNTIALMFKVSLLSAFSRANACMHNLIVRFKVCYIQATRSLHNLLKLHSRIHKGMPLPSGSSV